MDLLINRILEAELQYVSDATTSDIQQSIVEWTETSEIEGTMEETLEIEGTMQEAFKNDRRNHERNFGIEKDNEEQRNVVSKL